MLFRIPKGKHRARPLRLGIWFNKTIMRRRVTIHYSCKHDLEGSDQQDTNKLFGIGFLWNHQKESARFGWRYDKERSKFIISAYCYVEGQRIISDLCSVVGNRSYICILFINPGFYRFTVSQLDNGMELASYSVPYWHKKKWSFPLGLYFGGNQAAPHTMTMNIRKA